MKVILYMAISLNGIIARENREEDFLSDDNWLTFLELIKETGCTIWGRNTYEVVKKWEKKYFDDLEGIVKVIVSSDENYKIDPGFEKAPSPEKALEYLEKNGFDKVIVSGGSGLNTSFAKNNLIDEVIFNINPVVVGKGIPVFSPDNFDLNLEVIETKKISDQIIQVKYKVKK